MNKYKKLFWVLLWSFIGGSIGMDVMVTSLTTGLSFSLDNLVKDLLLGPVLMVSFGFMGWLGGALAVWMWTLSLEPKVVVKEIPARDANQRRIREVRPGVWTDDVTPSVFLKHDDK